MLEFVTSLLNAAEEETKHLIKRTRRTTLLVGSSLTLGSMGFIFAVCALALHLATILGAVYAMLLVGSLLLFAAMAIALVAFMLNNIEHKPYRKTQFIAAQTARSNLPSLIDGNDKLLSLIVAGGMSYLAARKLNH